MDSIPEIDQQPSATRNRQRQESFDSTEFNDQERQELTQMARSLRRMKRQLLLKHVEESQKPADSLQSLLLRAAYNSPPSSPRAPRTVVGSPQSSTASE